MTPQIPVLIIAGGIPDQEHPLYPYSQGRPKAMIEVNGRYMIEHVIDALQTATCVDQIFVIGLGEKLGSQLFTQHPIHHLPNQESLLKNTVVGINYICDFDPTVQRILLCAADIPLITDDMVDDFVERCTDDFGMYYALISQATMETRFPFSKRTYTKLKDIIFTGGDLCLTTPALVSSNLDLWNMLIGNRKSPLKIAKLIGWKTLFKYATRQLTIQDCNELATKLLHIPCKAIECPHAELGMDGDKPSQIEILRKKIDRKEQ